MSKDQIVVSGIGIYCPIGESKTDVLDAIKENKSGFQTIDEFDTDLLRNNKAGIIHEENLEQLRAYKFMLEAVEEAIEESGILDAYDDYSRIGISIGTSIGGYGAYVDKIYEAHEQTTELNNVSGLSDIDIYRNLSFAECGKHIAEKYGFSGYINSSITACSAGANAITFARDTIQSGRIDAAIVVGFDPISQLSYLGFNSLMALSEDIIRPMDKQRSGLLLGEGAAWLVIEKKQNAEQRKESIYGVISGCGTTNDAFHCTRPHPQAIGAILAMEKALNESNLEPSSIDYINIHGTGTKHNDSMELTALEEVFGEGFSTPISSTKSMFGHTLGAAGTVEAAISLLCMNEGILPPNLNCNENLLPNVVKKCVPVEKIDHVMSNSFGFGGNCASLIFSKYSSV